ncbi:MAG: outer membrane porin, OprD family, partial [Candidatus Eremiobacteraeota bacterium]|nr:outer membrane porin, OprD family [Candidatus Eremiobacteraeota bacterium]
MFSRLAAFVALSAAPLCCTFAADAQPSPSSTPIPQQVPAPTSTTTPHPSGPIPGLPGVAISGTLRAYDFARENRVQNASNPDRTAFNFGASLHLDYALGNTPLHIATTYFGAYPFGANGVAPQKNHQIDNTVPGFAMSTFDEAYLRYKDARTSVTAGDQVINTPWTPNSDSRLKPVAFQGIDASYTFGPVVALGVSRMIKFEGRTSSLFDRNTLLTSQPAGNPSYKPQDTSGFLLADLMIKPNKYVTASLDNYNFYDIANLFYAEIRGSLAPTSPYNPTVAVQYVNEESAGRRLVRRILNDTYGALIGANLNPNVLFQVGFDTAPIRYDTIAATSSGAAGKGIFLPAGGTTTTAALGGGLYRVAYG